MPVVPFSKSPSGKLMPVPDDQYVMMAAAQMQAESEGRQPKVAKAPVLGAADRTKPNNA